jgi:hypothetical protein
MYARINYAVGNTLRGLTAVLGTIDDYEVVQAFALTVAGFGGLEFAINRDAGNIVTSITSGCIVGTAFFLSIIGFTAILATTLAFVYYLCLGRDLSFDLPSLTGQNRGLRFAFSVAVSGLVTVAAFGLFYEGVRKIPILGPQYAALLYGADELDNISEYRLEWPPSGSVFSLRPQPASPWDSKRHRNSDE